MSHNQTPYRVLIVLGALALPLSYYIKQLRDSHSELSHKIIHHHDKGDTKDLAKHNSELKSLPQDIFLSKLQYAVFYDEATKVVEKSTLPLWDDEQLLITYLRHTMGRFASMPQAWIMWLMADKATKATFDQDHIVQSDFWEGDRICGPYTVLYRQTNRVEFGMNMGEPDDLNYIDGRLVISVQSNERKNQVTFKTQTLMWRREDSGTVMPMERSVPKWLHELASWGLVEQGVQHLQHLKQEQ